MDGFAMQHDSCSPSVSFCFVVDANVSGRVCDVEFLVEAVFAVGDVAQVFDTVVGVITVDVVDLVCGPDALDDEPDEPMSFVPFSVDADPSVTVSVGTGDFPDCSSLSWLFPSKVLPVVVQDFAGFFRCQIVFHGFWFPRGCGGELPLFAGFRDEIDVFGESREDVEAEFVEKFDVCVMFCGVQAFAADGDVWRFEFVEDEFDAINDQVDVFPEPDFVAGFW